LVLLAFAMALRRLFILLAPLEQHEQCQTFFREEKEEERKRSLQ
jgi:hypothetical protein